MGDFNLCKPGKSLGNFYQYVTCPTRHLKCLDLCFGTVKGAYKSLPRAPLGTSDHNVVYLVPMYKSVLKRHKVERRMVPVWTENSVHCLQDCFSVTDWDVFKNACPDLDELTETVSAYISFCEEMIIPQKSILIYPNNKPWVSKSVKSIINQRNISFNQGDMIQHRVLSKQLKRELKLAKRVYKDKVENLLRTGNSRPAWEGVKTIMGLQSKTFCITQNGKTDLDFSNELNGFYDRFNVLDFSEEMSVFKNVDLNLVNNTVPIDKFIVLKLFRGVKERKSPGPDGIGGRVLKNCAVQLADIFCFIFQLSLQLYKVPCIWKDSIIVPVPKIQTPKTLNDFRPVALTSLVMKTFERLVKDALLDTVQDKLDPLQFAYRSGRGVDDAIGTLLNMVFKRLEGAKSLVRLLFIDFSSAFNCIQPHVLADRLKNTYNIDTGLICWLMDFLTVRSQRVRVNSVLSDVLFSSTGSPQGCVLSPLLFVLYTNECQSHHERRHIIKFADDSGTRSCSAGFYGLVDAVCKKAHQRMHFLRKLCSFNVDTVFMEMFYSCFIESVLTFSFICWYGSLSIKQKNRMQGIVKVSSKIVGTPLNDLHDLYKVRSLKKARAILADHSHPLWDKFMLLSSGRRYSLSRCRTNRLKRSFIPTVITIVNNTL
ncbi:hypothetical protein PO909_025015 [Leuciscus waleckii]